MSKRKQSGPISLSGPIFAFHFPPTLSLSFSNHRNSLLNGDSSEPFRPSPLAINESKNVKTKRSYDVCTLSVSHALSLTLIGERAGGMERVSSHPEECVINQNLRKQPKYESGFGASSKMNLHPFFKGN